MVVLGLFAAGGLPAGAAPPARATLARTNNTPGLQHADKLGRSDPRRQLTIGVSLALRNEAQLEAFIAQVSDRKSPSYGHYLTPDQFTAAYGPSQAQLQQVVDHLRASGLSVGSVSSNRTIVDASGPVFAVEAAFGVSIFDWHDRHQNRDFFGNDTEPTLPAAIASYVVGVAGLNNHYPLHWLGPAPRVGSGPAGGYTPTELKTAYDITPLASAGYNGNGQRLGLFELDGFQQNNITFYDTQYGLGSSAPATVLIDGGPGALGNGEIEVELDIEVMHAIAPASSITVWEGPNTNAGVNDTYNAIVTSNTTKANSTSWGICEPNTTASEMTTLDNIFKQAAAQGQSFYAASGDNGAYDCGNRRLAVDSPASDPYITATGGTNLTLNADSSYQSESAWSNRNTLPASGSGGGLSAYFARPSWQTGPGVANTYSNGKRQVPDIALDADPQTGYSVYITYSGVTGWNVVGGTSAAAPGWAAFTAVYNQYAAAYSKPNLGYANPTLYSMASNAQAYGPFHDITAGDNLYYQATINWDYASGWGSYDAYNLARDLAGPPWSASYGVANTPTNWLTQNQTYTVTVSNTGTQTWPASGPNPVHLGVHFANAGGGFPTSYPWLTDQRFNIPADLQPGASVTLTIDVAAPRDGGNLVLEYQMVKEQQFWLTQFSDSNVIVKPPWSAQFDVANTPTTWADQPLTYPITLRNSGSQTWPASGSNPVHLGIHFANAGGGFPTSYPWLTDQRVNLPADLQPGASVTLTIAVAAPPDGGNLVLEYQMVKEQQFWLTQFSDVNVVVKLPWAAQFDVVNTSTTWNVNQSLTYAVTLRNTGSQAWPAGGTNPVHLGIHFANAGGGFLTSFPWLTDQRVNLPVDLQPGASVALTIVVTAPSSRGSLVVEYQMVKEQQFWFTQYRDVNVTVN